jgi:hypothetical protein
MRITGKLTAHEVKVIRRIYWHPSYRLNLFNNYTQRRMFQILGVVVLGAMLTEWIAHKARMNPTVVGWLVGAAGGGFLVYLVVRWHHLPPKALKQINKSQPEAIEIDDEGVRLWDAHGKSAALSWNELKGWRTGSHAILLDLVENANILPVPLQALSAEDKLIIRDILRRHLGEPTFVLSDARVI